jgi:hypothetical protein
VEDLRTFGGTHVNGQCIGDHRRELLPGDQVKLLPEIVFVLETSNVSNQSIPNSSVVG